MRPAGTTLILMLATLAFVASTSGYALQPVPAPPTIEMALPGMGLDAITGAAPAVPDMVAQFMRPRVPAMLALLVATWLALIYHAASQIFASRKDPSAAIPLPRRWSGDHHGALVIGLIAGAIWPWLLTPQPGGAFLLGAVMVAGFVGEALAGVPPAPDGRISASLGFAAGWATLAGCALVATLLHGQFGIPERVAAVIGVTMAALAAVSVQLRLGRTISYGIAVIWGMIGLAAGAVATQAALSMMAVLGIAIIAFALVRVTT